LWFASSSVAQELAEERDLVEPGLGEGVRFHHRHQPRSPEGIEEIGHLPPLAGPMVVDLRRGESIEALVQDLEGRALNARPVLVGVAEVGRAAARALAVPGELAAVVFARPQLAVVVAALVSAPDQPAGLGEVARPAERTRLGRAPRAGRAEA